MNSLFMHYSSISEIIQKKVLYCQLLLLLLLLLLLEEEEEEEEEEEP